ncbi:hypothetical protein [Mycoplasmopsis agassizii]|uniref:Uncharacterized protein n=1 Tax=Mycoplasmopsis agassizii TaxID=33922 RepID=A0ABX4H683_9BACT|nr:hypothetical protein [Mycoplasmopsis agassizii]PAF55332.1 hypothetical protein CJF60_01420 [Mycoplasmopsis agassizii]SMC15783.1 hypothetical protein SAMN02745179_00101 [Mycoplasmopsis agassizii]
MKKIKIISTIAAVSAVAVASGVAAAVLVLQKNTTSKTVLQNLYEKVSKMKGTISLNSDEASAMGVLTNQEIVDKAAEKLSEKPFKKAFTEINYQEIIDSFVGFEGITRLNLLKHASTQFKNSIEDLVNLNFDVKSMTKDDTYPLIATITITLGEITKDVVVNFVDEISSETTDGGDVITVTPDPGAPNPDPSSPVTPDPNQPENPEPNKPIVSTELSDKQVVEKITKAINGRQLVSLDDTVRAGAVYAGYLLSNSQTEGEKLKYVRKYVNLPIELTEEMIVSLVINQPSQYSDDLTVEIVFVKGKQLGVAAFSMKGFASIVNEFEEYWKEYSETFRTNPITVTTNSTANEFFEKIKDMQYANQLYEIAKIAQEDDENLKNAFSVLVTPVPLKFGATSTNTFSLVDGKDSASAGNLILTTKTVFNGIEKTAVILIRGFLSEDQSLDIVTGDPSKPLDPTQQAQKDANDLLSLLRTSTLNLKNDVGIVAAINRLRFINASTLDENQKLDAYRDYLAEVTVNEEMATLLKKSNFKKFVFNYDQSARSLTNILTISVDLSFGPDNDVQVTFDKLPILGTKKLEDFGDQYNPITIDFKNIEIDNFIEVERHLNFITTDMKNNRSIMQQLAQTGLGAFLLSHQWADIKFKPFSDGKDDKLSVHIKTTKPTKNGDGSITSEVHDVYIILKFTNRLKYKDVSLNSFLEAVNTREMFLAITKNGWVKSKISGLWVTSWHEHIMGWKPAEADIPRDDVNNWLWLLETPASIRMVGKDATWNFVNSKNVTRMYLYAAKAPRFYWKTGFGVDIVMFDNKGNKVPYSEKGLGREVMMLHDFSFMDGSAGYNWHEMYINGTLYY